jgi:hypothetical protein
MIYIAIGCLASVFLYAFDLNKIIFLHKNINICFAIGIALLAVSTTGVLFSNYKSFEVPVPSQLFFGLLSIIAMLLTLYSLFFALPFGKTYY